jgi:hypothetical protein
MRQMGFKPKPHSSPVYWTRAARGAETKKKKVTKKRQKPVIKTDTPVEQTPASEIDWDLVKGVYIFFWCLIIFFAWVIKQIFF